VLGLAAEGLSARDISVRLMVRLSRKTHFEHICAKLGATDRAAAVAHATRGGMMR
jgi:ATP/maltotriose-dependent transcriptional regulator MalT